ncbi:MAG: right-handed parallel beta-helix repeat-containing protein [Ignavibacteria bacterium]|jgi:hypothetical protein
MKNRIYYIFALLFMFQQVFAIYTTPGTGRNWNLDSLVTNSGGHITFSSGIYYINDTLIVSQSDTLKIFNNATVKLGNLSFINIYGTLLVNPPDSVKFTAIDTSQKHIGIRLDSLADASVLKKLIFEYGNSIYAFNCNMMIDSCTIRYNTNYASGMQSGAIALYKSDVTITNCKIYRNRRAAVVSGANIASSPTIINNLIYENDVENGNYPQINLGAASSNPVIIRNNTIIGLSPMSGGISFLPIGSVPSLIIENNIIKKNRYGIALQNVNINAYINNNIIDSNTAQGLPLLGGSGINIYGDSTIKVIATRNIIRWNLWGVTVQGSATKPLKPNFGNLSNTDTSDNGYNKIYYNSHNDTTFDFYYNITTTDTMRAENNYWGTTNADSIEAHVWHKIDFSTLGFVDYNPFRIVTGTEHNNISIQNDFKLFDAYPNPFNPSTNIKYQIVNSENGKWKMGNSLVILKIYNIIGKEIATLVNEKQSPGIYEINWDASNYSSGIYFYRITAGGFTDTKKLILMK